MSYEITSLSKEISVLVKHNIYFKHTPSEDTDTHENYMVHIEVQNGLIETVHWYREVSPDHYHPAGEPVWFHYQHDYPELLKAAQEHE